MTTTPTADIVDFLLPPGGDGGDSLPARQGDSYRNHGLALTDEGRAAVRAYRLLKRDAALRDRGARGVIEWIDLPASLLDWASTDAPTEVAP